MKKLTKVDIENILSEETGHPREAVSEILATLSSLAYKEAANGFTLPGFGEFSIHREPNRKMLNPFTKQEIIIQGNKEIKFVFDTTAEDLFLEGSSEIETEERKRKISAKSSDLPQIRLVPNNDDVVIAGIDAEWAVNVSKNKLGGVPDWLQGEELPSCCGTEMLFYGQFDSAIGGVFNLVDAGMLFVFWCKHCYKAKTVFQYC
jgi:nucleoid DNA-binding protein